MFLKLKDGARLYGHYLSINIRSAMQYKVSFFLTALGQFFVSFNVFLGIYFMFRGAFVLFRGAYGILSGGDVCQRL